MKYPSIEKIPPGGSGRAGDRLHTGSRHCSDQGRTQRRAHSAAAGGEHGEAGHGKASGKDEHSADSAKGEPAGHGEHADEGIVKLSDAQIEGAAITIVKAAPAMIGTVSQLWERSGLMKIVPRTSFRDWRASLKV